MRGRLFAPTLRWAHRSALRLEPDVPCEISRVDGDHEPQRAVQKCYPCMLCSTDVTLPITAAIDRPSAVSRARRSS